MLDHRLLCNTGAKSSKGPSSRSTQEFAISKECNVNGAKEEKQAPGEVHAEKRNEADGADCHLCVDVVHGASVGARSRSLCTAASGLSGGITVKVCAV